MIGAVTIMLGFGGFGAWAAVAPLQGAIIAPGKVTALGRNKSVQHLEGGIVKAIYVREGDHVRAGQALLVIDGTAAEALRNRIKAEIFALEALEARALAERNGEQQLVFLEDLAKRASDTVLKQVLEDQRAEFQARLARHNTELQIMRQQIGALEMEIAGLEAQQSAIDLQLQLVLEEKDDAESLFADELTPKARVLEAKRVQAQLTGQSGQILANIAKARQMIAEKEQEVMRIETARLEDASRRISEARRQRADFEEQLKAAEDTLARTVVRAPEAGTVVNLTQNGPGAVLAPGADILTILPESADLIVEAHVRPQDIDQVRVGQPAHLTFSALDQRSTPPVPGEVTFVSADRLENGRTGEIFYIARMRISAEPLPGFDITDIGAGQPVEAFITTSERTFLSYLMEPFLKTIRRAARD